MMVFQTVKNDLAERLPEVLSELLPGGSIRGVEYVCGSLQGNRGDSCSTNIRTGVGSDFATGERWGDVIDLASQVWRVGQMEAAQKLQERYGVGVGDWRQLPVKAVVDDGWTIVQPIPENAPDLPDGWSGKWCYRSSMGEELFYVLRFDKPDGGKRVQPMTFWRNKDSEHQWRFKAFPAPRPLYGLDRLAKASPNTPILLVEGEKTADAAQALFPDYVCLTWSGGSSAASKTDFSPLTGRSVTIWPDADSPGLKAAVALKQTLTGIAKAVRIVQLPDGLPSEWDLADTCPQDMDLRTLLETDAANGVGRIEFLDAGRWLLEPIQRMPVVMSGLCDEGDKVFLIGGPKTRKSFFTMQMALCLATGGEFLGFDVPAPCRVAVCQMEIQPHHYHARLSRLAYAKGIGPADLEGKLYVANLRGISASMDEIMEALSEFKPQVLVLDPLYKAYGQGHDENSAGDAAALLAQFDRMAKVLGCALVVVHHDNKSASGVTKATSRGSGSNVLMRDCDASITLTAHATEVDALVMECVLRNHPPREPVTILWDVDRFVVANNIPAMPETVMSRATKAKQGPGTSELVEAAKGFVHQAGGRMQTLVLRDQIQTRLMVGRDKAEMAIRFLETTHNFVRGPDPKTHQWHISEPGYKPVLPEPPELPGFNFQGVQGLAQGGP